MLQIFLRMMHARQAAARLNHQISAEIDGTSVMAAQQKETYLFTGVLLQNIADGKEVSFDFDIFSLSMVIYALCIQ